ncbi:MAG TPA: DUF2795 domain-containing protein [Candidatus Elarobacter sp.]|jgi:hypothetical protein
MATNTSGSNPKFRLEQEIAAAMRGIRFPAKRDDILNRAKENGASEEVLRVLERIPDGEYGTPAQVMDATND